VNDGNEIVAHLMQNVGYTNILGISANARGYSQSHLHPEFLRPTGCGNGGGGLLQTGKVREER